MNLDEVSDDFNPKKSIRIMRIGLLFLIIFGRLPERFVKRVKKYIAKLNKEYDRIEEYYG